MGRGVRARSIQSSCKSSAYISLETNRALSRRIEPHSHIKDEHRRTARARSPSMGAQCRFHPEPLRHAVHSDLFTEGTVPLHAESELLNARQRSEILGPTDSFGD